MTQPFLNSVKMTWYLFVVGILIRGILAATLGLSDDEAWYWALSQRIDWSYVVHPPLSIWMISLSTKVFGNNALAVRLPAIGCMAIGIYWLVGLANEMGYRRGAYMVVSLSLISPLLLVGGILVGPDLPLFLSWAGLMNVSYKLGTSEEKVTKRWVLLGVFAGVGMLSKFTALLALPILLIWIFSTNLGRRNLQGFGPRMAMVIAVVLFAPVILWNWSHNWSSLHFQFVERHQGESAQFKRWGLFWISQFMLMGPVLFLGWFVLVKRWKSLAERFLVLWAVFPGLVFFIQPLYSPFKIHWALFAFIPIMIYAAKLVQSQEAVKFIRYGVIGSFLTTALGLVCLYVPVAPHFASFLSKQQLDPRHDITNDFYGWKSFAEAWHKLPLRVQSAPLVTAKYQIAAQAAFALKQKNLVHIIPRTHAEVQDWGGPFSTLPARFLYIADNRYKENPQTAFPNFTCQLLSLTEVMRAQFLAKRFEMHLCLSQQKMPADGTTVAKGTSF